MKSHDGIYNCLRDKSQENFCKEDTESLKGKSVEERIRLLEEREYAKRKIAIMEAKASVEKWAEAKKKRIESNKASTKSFLEVFSLPKDCVMGVHEEEARIEIYVKKKGCFEAWILDNELTLNEVAEKIFELRKQRNISIFYRILWWIGEIFQRRFL
jgi:hypothetical protein